MATLRQVILVASAALLVWITTPALAQPHRTAAGVHVDAFDVEQVPRLTSGTRLNFSLYGTSGAAATLQIDGGQRGLDLHEVQAGVYEGTYTIDAQDQIRPDGHVTATLRLGNRVVRSVLAEPLQLGAMASPAAPPPPARRAPVEPQPARGAPAEPTLARGAPVEPTLARGVPVEPTLARGAPVEPIAPVPAPPHLGNPVPAAPACAECAVVESVRAVESGGFSGRVGSVAGGVAGAVFGEDIGRAHGRHVAWVVGTLSGAFAGRDGESDASGRIAYDVVLRLPNGATQTRHYDRAPPFGVGDTVWLGAPGPARAQRAAAPF